MGLGIEAPCRGLFRLASLLPLKKGVLARSPAKPILEHFKNASLVWIPGKHD
jgi:hypothetical protein